MTAQTTLSYDDFASELGIKSKSSRDRAQAVCNRFAALGLDVVCSRCGGSGKHSFNAMDGDRCYGCSGRGKCAPKLTRALLDAMIARQNAGELDAYFARNRANAEAKRLMRPLLAQIDAEWSGGTIHAEFKTHGHFRAPVDVVNAAGLINSYWRERNRVENAKDMSSQEKLSALESILSEIKAINAAFAQYRAETPAVIPVR